MGSAEFPTRNNCATGEVANDHSWLNFGGQVCGEGSPAADGYVPPAGRSEAEALQEGPQGDGRGRVESGLLGGNKDKYGIWQNRP